MKRTLTAWSKCPAKWKITESVASSNVSHASRPRMRLLPELGFSASSALTCSLSHSGYRSQGYLRMLLLRCCLDRLPKKYRFPSQPVGGDDNNNNGATHGGQRMSSGSGGGGGRDLIPVWCGSVVCGVVCGSVVCGSSRRWEVDCPQPARRLQENTGRRSSLQSANSSSADQWQGL